MSPGPLARLLRIPWKAARGAVGRVRLENRVRRGLELARLCDFDAGELAANQTLLAAAEQSDAKVRSINWYVPYFHHAFYGGIHTILRFASGFAERHGAASRFVIYDRPAADAAALHKAIAAAFPALAAAEVLVLPEPGAAVPEADAAIATLWPSAYLLLKARNVRRKLYFVQDFEPLFYAAGTESALAEQTYRFGFPALVNTPGLAAILRRDYGGRVGSFVPAVDTQVFHPPAAPRTGPFRAFLYGRPEVDRNAFALGLAALDRFAALRGAEVEAVVAGSPVPDAIRASFPRIDFRGLLPYAATGDLYRSCHAGIALMLTRHPSYLPFELMACGAVPVVSENPANGWLLRHEENALVTAPGVTALASALERLFADPALRERLGAAGAACVLQHRWDDQVDEALRFLQQPGQEQQR